MRVKLVSVGFDMELFYILLNYVAGCVASPCLPPCVNTKVLCIVNSCQIKFIFYRFLEPRQKTEKPHFSMSQELPWHLSKKCQQQSLFIQAFQFTNFLLSLEELSDCGWGWELCSSVSLESLWCQILKEKHINKKNKYYYACEELSSVIKNYLYYS